MSPIFEIRTKYVHIRTTWFTDECDSEPNHFACVCPAFREARTAAHNQLRAVLAVSLKDAGSDALSEDWAAFEETPLAATGLKVETATGTDRRDRWSSW